MSRFENRFVKILPYFALGGAVISRLLFTPITNGVTRGADWILRVIGGVLGIYLISLVLYFIISRIIYLINNHVDKTRLKNILLNILIIVFTIIVTVGSIAPGATTSNSLPDKSQENSEVIGNLYRNKKYHFRIKFPEGWDIKPGDSLRTVQKATHDGHSLAVLVEDFSSTYGSSVQSISEVGTMKDFTDKSFMDLKQKLPSSKVVDYGETKIANETSYWYESTYIYESLNSKIPMTQRMYFLVKNGILYSISAATATEKYEEIRPTFLSAISTFIFE